MRKRIKTSSSCNAEAAAAGNQIKFIVVVNVIDSTTIMTLVDWELYFTLCSFTISFIPINRLYLLKTSDERMNNRTLHDESISYQHYKLYRAMSY